MFDCCAQAKAGFVLNLLCILVIMVGIHTWGAAIFPGTQVWLVKGNETFTTVATMTAETTF